MMKKICLIGPMPGYNSTTGVQDFNQHLAIELREMGHDVTIALPQGGVLALPMAMRTEKATGCEVVALPNVREDIPSPAAFLSSAGSQLAQALGRFEQAIISGSNFAYGRILRAAECPAAVWTHGQQISPFARWDGAELKRPGAKLVCINSIHMREAQMRGFEEQAVMIEIPVLQEPGEVLPASNFAVAVGNLENRKNYPAVAEIAERLKRDTRVYGGVVHDRALAAVERSKRLQRRGFVPNETLWGEAAAAEFIVHTAFTEGFPVAIRNANAQGIPAITWNIPPYSDSLNPARNILLEPKRPIADQLAEIAADNGLKKYRAIANRRALAQETHERFGKAAFRGQLTELIGG